MSTRGGEIERSPLAWHWLLALTGARLAVYAFANGSRAYGFMTDEYYYLDCTEHLALGYVDHPPLSIWLLWLVRATLGDSIEAVRLLPALAHCVTLVLAGWLARELGGGRRAQAFAALMTLTSPLIFGVTATYSMNSLEFVLWMAAAVVIAKLLRGTTTSRWLSLGAILGLGLLNKLSMLWFGLGFAVGLLATDARRQIATPGPWLAAALAALIFLPNLFWQHSNGWATAEFMRATAVEKQLTYTSPVEFLLVQLFINGVPFWPMGLVWYFRVAGRRHRLLGWLFGTVFVLLLVSGSAKPYYAAPVYPIVFAAAGVWFEGVARMRVWLAPVAAAALVGMAVLLAPLGFSLVPPERLARALEELGVGGLTVDVTEASPLPQHFAQMFHGEAVVRAVEEAATTLSADERKKAFVLAGHFGEAGPINFHRRELDLPPAVGGHTGYWLWGPGDATADVMIVVAEPGSALLENWREVVRVSAIDCLWCMPYLTDKSLYVVRGPERSIDEIWPELRDFE